ncbi:MAG: 5-methyltetrahydropteroyltriglutamate--homocysteine methyltransferase, partial [Candidatus Binatia bacterium]
GIITAVAVHVCYGYAYRFPNKQADPAYAAALETLAACQQVRWSFIEYAQPKHEPELLKHCGDKGVILGVLDLATENIEAPQAIAQRVRAALEFISPQSLNLAPDCGMWHLPRQVAFAKLRALVQGAEIVSRELNLTS